MKRIKFVLIIFVIIVIVLLLTFKNNGKTDKSVDITEKSSTDILYGKNTIKKAIENCKILYNSSNNKDFSQYFSVNSINSFFANGESIKLINKNDDFIGDGLLYDVDGNNINNSYTTKLSNIELESEEITTNQNYLIEFKEVNSPKSYFYKLKFNENSELSELTMLFYKLSSYVESIDKESIE